MSIDPKQIAELRRLWELADRDMTPAMSEGDGAAYEIVETLPALLSEREEMLALLRRCEWAGEDDGSRDRCPLCNGRMVDGHRPACDLAAFLKET